MFVCGLFTLTSATVLLLGPAITQVVSAQDMMDDNNATAVAVVDDETCMVTTPSSSSSSSSIVSSMTCWEFAAGNPDAVTYSQTTDGDASSSLSCNYTGTVPEMSPCYGITVEGAVEPVDVDGLPPLTSVACYGVSCHQATLTNLQGGVQCFDQACHQATMSYILVRPVSCGSSPAFSSATPSSDRSLTAGSCYSATFVETAEVQCTGGSACTGATFETTVGVVSCTGDAACQNANFLQGGASDDDDYDDDDDDVCARLSDSDNATTTPAICTQQQTGLNASCAGQISCQNAVVENLNTLSCVGQASCRSAQANATTTVDCVGSIACERARLTNIQTVNCSGDLSCMLATVSNVDNLLCARPPAAADACNMLIQRSRTSGGSSTSSAAGVRASVPTQITGWVFFQWVLFPAVVGMVMTMM